MKIYIDSRINQFFIQGVSSGPVIDYQVTASGNNISVFRPSTQAFDIYNIPFTALSDVNGNAFSDVTKCLNYLTALTVYQGALNAIYPLQLNSTNNNLTLDQISVTNGGDF